VPMKILQTFQNGIGQVGRILGLLITPMTPSKFGKLAVLSFIFLANFRAWGEVISAFAAGLLPGWLGFLASMLGGAIAVVGFTLCQWFEAAPEIQTMGCESPDINADRLALGGRSRFHAALLAQDAEDELVTANPVEIVRAKQAQALAFAVDLMISGPAWYPFSAPPLQLLIAPLGFLDFNLFNLFMLLTTVFFTPKILISAIRDGRIKTARVA
ncbi:MAG TPA: hypothetical protein V6D06_17000, partial [Trichocoleus sp.]